MIDIISLFLIVIFVPLIVLVGVKLYKPKDLRKLFIAFSITLLAIELLRFFVNASFYENAVVPSQDLKLSFVTFLSVIVFFAVFNKGKIGNILKNIFVLTSICPIIIALFNKNVYFSTLDTYGLIKALYFLECGVVILLTILFVLDSKESLNLLQLGFGCIFALGYVFVNFLANYFWTTNVKFDGLWFAQMAVLVVSVGVVYLLLYIVKKFCKKSVKEENTITNE